MTLYNSLSRSKEKFIPLNPPKVSLYACGPTVYDYSHIGHARKYVNDDILRRTLEFLGYNITHVQNITDVGHLVSDADEGEDKLEKGARKYGKAVEEVAEHFTVDHFESLAALNILKPSISPKASDHIREQVDLIKRLVRHGCAYDTPEAVYFDVSTYDKYENLFGQTLEDKIQGARDAVNTDTSKRHPADFALWIKRVGPYESHIMHWDSPWGDGFPGWHIECSAMAMKYLGETIDIHTGGIDHLSIHHPNEIAQSECATGQPFVRFWVHHEFLLVDGKKMSKSLGNVYRVRDIKERGYEPLALRYLFLGTHYRKPQNFTWEALGAASKALIRIRTKVNQLDDSELVTVNQEDPLLEGFIHAMCDDLNTPEALRYVWEILEYHTVSDGEKISALKQCDRILGLDLLQSPQLVITVETDIKALTYPEEVIMRLESAQEMADEREIARANGDFKRADSLRDKITDFGFTLEDTTDGYRINVDL